MKLEKEETVRQAEEFVQDILSKAGLLIEVAAQANGDDITFDLTGPDSEFLLSDGARLLYAVNHLVNQVFYRRSKDGLNFFLDCNNYRSDRTAELELMAIKAAEQVRLSGGRILLQPMPSSERRIIHLALAGQQGVRTESQGTGRFRRVLILASY